MNMYRIIGIGIAALIFAGCSNTKPDDTKNVAGKDPAKQINENSNPDQENTESKTDPDPEQDKVNFEVTGEQMADTIAEMVATLEKAKFPFPLFEISDENRTDILLKLYEWEIVQPGMQEIYQKNFPGAVAPPGMFLTDGRFRSPDKRYEQIISRAVLKQDMIPPTDRQNDRTATRLLNRLPEGYFVKDVNGVVTTKFDYSKFTAPVLAQLAAKKFEFEKYPENPDGIDQLQIVTKWVPIEGFEQYRQRFKFQFSNSSDDFLCPSEMTNGDDRRIGMDTQVEIQREGLEPKTFGPITYAVIGAVGRDDATYSVNNWVFIPYSPGEIPTPNAKTEQENTEYYANALDKIYMRAVGASRISKELENIASKIKFKAN